MKKYCNLILLVLVMVMCFTVPAFADVTEYDVSAAGDGSVMASFDSATGTLTISGNGPMKDFTSSAKPTYATHAKSIKKVVIEEGVTRIGSYAFYLDYRTVAIEELDIFPSTVESVGTYAFYSFNYAGDLVIPGTVKTIESNAFYGGAYSTITLENGVESIGASGFYGCNATAISIPESVSFIGDNVFGNMSYVSEFVCLVNEAHVFDGMFSGGFTDTPRWMGYSASTKVATVSDNQYYLIETLEALGYTVNTVASPDLDPADSYPTGTFGGATYVTEIGADGDNVIAALNGYSGSMNLWGSGATMDYNSNKSGSRYNNYNPISPLLGHIKTIEIEEGITEIGRETFSFTVSYAADKVTSVTLPSTLTRIGYKAFSMLGSSSTLPELVIPENVETIDASAFESARISTIYNLSKENQNVNTSAFNGLAGNPTVYQYSANTAMETAAKSYAKEIVYLDDSSVVLSGTLDNGITWVYDPATKTLTFDGNGEIPDFEDGQQPWYGAATQYGGIGTYQFGENITGIGTGIFGSYGNSAYGSDGSGASAYGPAGLNYGGVAYAGTAGGGGSSGGNQGGGNTGDDNTGSGSGSSDSTTPPTDKDAMIILDAVPTNFMVTVPIKIDAFMRADGQVNTGDNYVVENACAWGPVIIKDIKVVAETNWNLADWSADFKNMRASTKKFAITINGVEVATSGAVTLNESLSSVIKHQESKDLFFDIKLPAQKTALQENIAAIVFTVDFDKV